MIPTKIEEEIEIMKEGGQRLAKIKETLLKLVKPGNTPRLIDEAAEELIAKFGGQPSFKMVPGYKWATCVNVNQGVVHGIPQNKPFKEGDLVSVDVGIFYRGFHTDTSFTAPAGKTAPEPERFLRTGRQALARAIEKAKPGGRISDISKTIESVVSAAGYSPVRSLTGHGIGRALHEAPQIPCFWEDEREGEVIPLNSVLAIEVIYTQGSPEVVLAGDGWTISTQDGKIAGLFEETVAVTGGGPLVLTA